MRRHVIDQRPPSVAKSSQDEAIEQIARIIKLRVRASPQERPSGNFWFLPSGSEKTRIAETTAQAQAFSKKRGPRTR
jgi:ATP-dependent Clp protease ATP-binding subunit ClpA